MRDYATSVANLLLNEGVEMAQCHESNLTMVAQAHRVALNLRVDAVQKEAGHARKVSDKRVKDLLDEVGRLKKTLDAQRSRADTLHTANRQLREAARSQGADAAGVVGSRFRFVGLQPSVFCVISAKEACCQLH